MKLIRTLATTALALGAFAAGASCATKTDAGTSTSSPVGSAVIALPSTTEAPAKGTNRANPIPMGEEVEAAKGWFVKVNTVNLDATKALTTCPPNSPVIGGSPMCSEQYNKPQPGQRFVLANFSIRNGTDRPDMAGTHLRVSLLGQTNVGITESYITIPGRLNSAAQLQPGATSTGSLVYEVPADDMSVVLLAEPQMTLDKTIDQRFLALQ